MRRSRYLGTTPAVLSAVALLVTVNVAFANTDGNNRDQFPHQFIAIAIIVTVVVVGGTIAGFREWRFRRRIYLSVDLEYAPRRYNLVAKQIEAFLPQCRSIVSDQAKQGRAFIRGSQSVVARKKSLRLIRDALGTSRLLRDNNVTLGTYRAVEALTRLERQCVRCKNLNKGKRHAVCHALTSESQVAVDLNFKVREEGG